MVKAAEGAAEGHNLLVERAMNTIRNILFVAAVASLGGTSLVTSTTSAEARFERLKSFAARGASFTHRTLRPAFRPVVHIRTRPLVAHTPNGPIKVPCDFNCVRPKPPVVIHRPPVIVQRPPVIVQRPIVVSAPAYVAPSYAAPAYVAPATYTTQSAYAPPAPTYNPPVAVAPPAYTPPPPVAAPTAVSQEPVAASEPANCITKQYTQDGQVMFIDRCTNEQAVASVAPAQGVQSEEDADPQIRQQ
jgi:hypothetical protein